MSLYSVFEQPAPADEAPTFVEDGFSWFAALLPPVHAVVHGLWLSLVAILLGVALAFGVSRVLGPDAGFWTYVLLAVFYGFESATLRRVALRRRGWTFRSDLVAPSRDMAELEWLKLREASL